MIRLDTRVSVMVANEKDVETIEKALKTGVVVLMTSDDIGVEFGQGAPGMGFAVLLIDGTEEHADAALKILG